MRCEISAETLSSLNDRAIIRTLTGVLPMTPSQRDKLAALLTRRRTAKAMSIRGVAAAAGVDAATVLSLEQGRIAQPKAEKLRAVGTALGIPAAELYATVGWLPGSELPAF